MSKTFQLKTKSSDWLSLKNKLPENFHHICNLGHKFDLNVEHILKIKEHATWLSLKEFQCIMYEIITEYFSLVKPFIKLPKDEKDLRNDVRQTISRFFDKDGRMLDLSRSLNKRNLEVELPLLISPIESFINSRIYYSLLNSIEDYQAGISTNFARIAISQAGLNPEICTIEPKSLEKLENDGDDE